MAPLLLRRHDSNDLRSLGLKARRRPSLRARLRARWSAAELDEALADAANPLASDEILLRATALVQPETRGALAESLERLVEQVVAGGPSPHPGPTILRREPVARNCGRLLALAERLRADSPHCLRGLAMANRFVRYGDSPLYVALGPLELMHRIEEVLAALDRGWDGQPADTPHGDSR